MIRPFEGLKIFQNFFVKKIRNVNFLKTRIKIEVQIQRNDEMPIAKTVKESLIQISWIGFI
jgi:hypothetical protein